MIRKRLYIFILIFTAALLGLGYAGISKKSTDTPVLITEVCPHNISAAYDDNGDYGADYIELYNRSEEAINLEGWGLSDDGNELSKFVFPKIEIEPGGTIIAWCSPNTDDVSFYRDTYVPVDVHDLGFGLSNGESCILTDLSGSVVSDVTIPQQLSDDESYSSTVDNLLKFTVSRPTPRYVEMTPYKEKRELESPVFSVDGGWFSDSIEVELSCKEGEIYYTLDGSMPDENAIKYDGPVTIGNRTGDDNIYSDIYCSDGYIPDYNVDKGTVLKAVAITEDGISQAACETYFVGLNDEDYKNLGIVSISFPPEAFFGYETGIYVFGKVADLYKNKINTDIAPYDSWDYCNYGKKGRGWEREVQIEYIPAGESTASYSQKVGIRIHGGYSVNHNQKNFQIYSREKYDGNQYFTYDFFGDGSSYSKLMLRGGGSEDRYVTKMRDVFLQSLASDRAVGTQRAIPCAVFLNGEYWGLYNIQETVDESYVSAKYGVDEGNVLIIKNGESRSDNPEDVKLYDAVLEFDESNDLSVTENYRKIEEMIDIQSCIDYYSLQIYTANCDAYENNWAVWRSIDKGSGEYEDCRFRWLIFDLDDAAGIEEGFTTPEVDSFTDGNFYGITPLDGDVLFSSLIKNQEFKERFAASFMDMADNNFAYDAVSAKLWSMADIYRNGVIKSHERFRGDMELLEYPGNAEYTPPYSDEDFGTDIGYIDAFFRDRRDYITEYMNRDLGLDG